MINSEIDTTVEEIRKLNKASNKRPQFTDNVADQKAMKRKMAAARLIENRRIDQDE